MSWEWVDGYDNETYTDDMIFEVDYGTKKVQKITGQTLISGENNSQFIRFIMDRYYDGVDLSTKNIQIIYLTEEKYSDINAAVCVERSDDQIRFGWLVPAEACYDVGTTTFSIEFVGDRYTLKTQAYDLEVLDGLNGGEVVPEPTDKAWYIELQERCDYVLNVATDAKDSAAASEAHAATSETNAARSEANAATSEDNAQAYANLARGAAYGSPYTANTASAMTDNTRVYVYTGSETGYTAGHWYYWNGTVWADGGVYNSVAVDVDETLTVRGKAPDSKVVGDRFAATVTDIAEALTTANNAENHMAQLDNQMRQVIQQLDNVSIDPDDLGLEQDPDTYYVYPTYKGVRSENGIPLSSGGGGGGGGDVIDAVLSVENTSGWLSKTIASGAQVSVSFLWSSIEDEMPTGDGTIRITVNDVVRSTYQIRQGNVSVDLTPYLTTGTNKVKVRISDVYDQGKTTTFNITSIVLSISSPFDATQVYSGAISFPYTPVGAVEKTIYFNLDGQQIGTYVTSVSGRQLTYTIPAQSHGGHTLKVYYEATINGETVRSNELYYEFISVVAGDNTAIIVSSFSDTTQQQYSSIAIPFMVYNPTSLTANVTISVNGEQVSVQTVDRTEQSYTYKADTAGTLNVVIASGGASKTIQIIVTESDVHVEAETEDLALFLTAYNKSNLDTEHRDEWKYGSVQCTLSGFNWASDGWLKDTDGITALRVSGDARLSIPYKLFGTDFRNTGKTIELEFATSNILDYDAVILSCMSGGRGLSVTAQKATLTSEQSEISTQYKEDEHVRIAFVAEKRAENRLLYIYINGIASGVVQYPVDDNFAQTNPVDITVGSNNCTIDLYCIRVYDNDLTRHQIVNNWIADTQVGSLMLDRYKRNNVFDAYGNIVINQLPSDLPYMIISCAELPQSKGDKKICSGSFTNPLYPSKSFTFEDCQIDVQGTSSQYYARKNYKMKFNGGFVTASGTVAKYAMNTDAIPVKTFCMKADYASSEGANNVELVRLYESACPYKTPAQRANPNVRQGIDGFPILIFWNDTVNQTTTFIGKYNFNNDKSTEEVFGFESPDESWETLNNASDRALYKSGDFSGSAWEADFEARYPDTDPAYKNIAQLAEFATWAASTDTTAASGNALPEAVTYGETTYTTDSAEYRLAKFKAEAGDYMEMQSALFYYLFTELFLMVDSRAKNAFPSFIGSEVSTS